VGKAARRAAGLTSATSSMTVALPYCTRSAGTVNPECSRAGRSHQNRAVEISLQAIANDPFHRAAGHFLGRILVTSAVNTNRAIKRVLMLL
ncbi:MAG: hypothetical protein WCA23_21070, partial [Stellaceae bacterium]